MTNTPVNEDELFVATSMPDRDWWQVLWPDPAETLRKVGVRAGMDVVDLCCGDGYFTAPLSRLVEDAHVYAVDIVEELLRQARREVEGIGGRNVTFIRGDVRSLVELVGRPVDLVLIANTFHGVDDQPGLTDAVRRGLKSAGRFVVINWRPLPREETMILGEPRGPREELRMAPETVRNVVEDVGFSEVEVLDVGPYHYASIFERDP